MNIGLKEDYWAAGAKFCIFGHKSVKISLLFFDSLCIIFGKNLRGGANLYCRPIGSGAGGGVAFVPSALWIRQCFFQWSFAWTGVKKLLILYLEFCFSRNRGFTTLKTILISSSFYVRKFSVCTKPSFGRWGRFLNVTGPQWGRGSGRSSSCTDQSKMRYVTVNAPSLQPYTHF